MRNSKFVLKTYSQIFKKFEIMKNKILFKNFYNNKISKYPSFKYVYFAIKYGALLLSVNRRCAVQKRRDAQNTFKLVHYC